MATAILVIDVQNALCYGEHAVFEAERVIERINHVSAKARSCGAPVFLIQHESPTGPLEPGTDGWKLARGVVVEESDVAIQKTTADAFHKTRLQSELEKRGVDRLVICGVQSDFCVDTTTRRALALGYPVTLVSDAHSTRANEVLDASQIAAHHAATLANITSFGPRVTLRSASDLEV
jgi:nicotinamidase-related amidase